MKIRLTIFLVLTVSHRVQSQTRLVVNTTCLELVEPSNQQFRLTCSNPSDYHCLLDETFTQEYEACRDWKWIPGGKCAYFNTYGRGNIDERNCILKTNLTCSHGIEQFSSATNTEYTACYVKKEIGTSLPATASPAGTHSVEGNQTVNGISDEGNATSFSTTSDKHYQRAVHALPIILGIIVPLISLAVIYFIFMHLKYVPLYRKESKESSDKMRNEDTVEKQPILSIEVEDTPEIPPTMRHEDENVTGARRNDTVEKQPVLRNEVEGTSESPPTMRHKDENITGARRNGNSGADDHADVNDSDLLEHFEDAVSSPTSIKHSNSEVSADKHQKGDNNELGTNEDSDKSAEVDIAGDLKGGESKADKSDNEEDEEESTDVFDDTVESLQRIAPPNDEQVRELCTELYSLLGTEGLKLTQEVMRANITRVTKKSMEELVGDERNLQKLREILPIECHRFIESKAELGTSFYVSYGLHQIVLGEKHCPKSGWGNPVRGKDIGIGDDIERLYRIQTIVRGIPNQENISVESYIRLLDNMIEALTRLDHDAEFKEDYKLLSYKLEIIKNPNLTQTMLKKIRKFLKLW